MSLPIEERLWARVQKAPSGCWEWTGGRFTTGYGVIRYEGRSQGTHRVAYILTKGPIPAGLVVMHSCDNPPCVNPAHLSLGTVADNNRDRADKGRSVTPDEWYGWQRSLTHCRKGHPFDATNTRWKSPDSNGKRVCRACVREASARARARRRQAGAA